MGYTIEGFTVGIFPADVDMSNEGTWQYTPVWIGAPSNVAGFAGAAVQGIGSFTGPPLGVLQNNPKQNETAAVMVSGISKAKMAGVCAIGDPVGWNGGGTGFIKALSTFYAIGTALEVTASGDVSAILLVPRGKQ